MVWIFCLRFCLFLNSSRAGYSVGVAVSVRGGLGGAEEAEAGEASCDAVWVVSGIDK